MESVLEFINMNYIWLIIIAVVILLALVGYIADKQGFGNSQKSKNKKNNKLENENSKIEKLEKINEDESNNDLIKEDLDIEKVIDEELKYDDEESLIEEQLEEIDEQLVEDTDKLIENNDLDSQFKSIEFNEEDDFNIDDDFNKVLNDVENSSNDLYMEMPKEIDEEEDVWKF